MSTPLEQQARELAAQMRNESILRDSNEAVNGAIRLIEAALQRVRDEGAEDTKRLDWLAEQIGPGYAGGIVTVANLIPTHGGNLRHAIDAAMRPTPEKESP